MRLLDSITSDPNQSFKIALDDGTKVNFSLTYKQGQLGWFYSLTYGSFQIKNRRIVNSPNMLRAFREIIPFGLACVVLDLQEPLYVDDFSGGRVELYILNPEDVAMVEANIL